MTSEKTVKLTEDEAERIDRVLADAACGLTSTIAASRWAQERSLMQSRLTQARRDAR